jgi:O-antigen ligase
MNQIALVAILSIGFLFAIVKQNPIVSTSTALIKTLILVTFIKFLQNSNSLQRKKLLLRINSIIAVSGIIGGLEMLLQKSLLISETGSTKLTEMGRYSGLFSWQNIATICHSISLLWLVNEFSRLKRSYRNILILANIVGLISSASLSGLLGLTISVVFFLIKTKKNRKQLVVPISIFIVFIATTSSVLLGRIKEALGSDVGSTNLYVSNNSLEWRLIQWRFIIQKIRSQWLFGYGIGSSNGVADFNGYLSHNTYLTVLLEFGIFGFGLIAICVIISMRNFLRSVPKNNSVFVQSVYICVAISGFAENLPYQVALYILIPLVIYNSKETLQVSNSRNN